MRPLRMVAGLETISSGTISIGGRCVNTVPPKDRDIAMVFQNYALYPHMTVYDNMAFGLKLRGFHKREIEKQVSEAAEGFWKQATCCSVANEQTSGRQRQQVAAQGAPSCANRRSFCLTSRSLIWMPRCAWRCVAS